jgi:hypothetical protein
LSHDRTPSRPACQHSTCQLPARVPRLGSVAHRPPRRARRPPPAAGNTRHPRAPPYARTPRRRTPTRGPLALPRAWVYHGLAGHPGLPSRPVAHRARPLLFPVPHSRPAAPSTRASPRRGAGARHLEESTEEKASAAGTWRRAVAGPVPACARCLREPPEPQDFPDNSPRAAPPADPHSLHPSPTTTACARSRRHFQAHRRRRAVMELPSKIARGPRTRSSKLRMRRGTSIPHPRPATARARDRQHFHSSRWRPDVKALPRGTSIPHVLSKPSPPLVALLAPDSSLPVGERPG